MRMMTTAISLAILMFFRLTDAFVLPQIASNLAFARTVPRNQLNGAFVSTASKQPKSIVAHQMYNLPPSGGGGGGNNNGLQEILYGIGGIVVLGLFFASPLGGIFFAITNSLLVLSFLLPIVALVGFQIWQKFNVVEGSCPNCGAPCSALKDREQRSFCFNCGAVVRASPDGVSIELDQQDVIVDEGYTTGSVFDNLFGNVFSNEEVVTTTTTTTTTTTAEEKQKKFKRENTIIDVEVEE